MLQVKDKKQIINNKIGVLAHIKAYYECYEIIENGSLHIYSLLWLNGSPNPDTTVQMLCDNEGFQKHMIDYLNNIITRDIKQYKLTSKMTHINDEIQHIHPCTTRPFDRGINTFDKLFQNDVCNLMNVCNRHVCNLACYKTNVDILRKLCRYNFLQPLINEIHFDNKTRFLHIKRTNKWLNNANPWMLSTSKCNHDMKFIITLGKDSKFLIYYITDYITKTSIYIMHMYSFLQIKI
jgi:hypothetical protein